MIDKPAEGFDLSLALQRYRVTVQYSIEEQTPNTYHYAFVAAIPGGHYGELEPAYLSHGSTPEAAVHNVIELRHLLIANDTGHLNLESEVALLDQHKIRYEEALKLWTGPFAAKLDEDRQLTPEDFGKWIDEVTGDNNRDPQRVAGRALEEMVEGCLEIGLSYGKVMEHVADAWHNQCLKVSAQEGQTVWPSQLHQHVIPSDAETIKEIADTRLTLLDLQHLLRAREQLVQLLMRQKADKLKAAHLEGRLRFNSGTFYIVKDHVK